MKTRVLKWLGVLLLGLTGCYDFSEFDNITVDPFSSSWGFPVVKSRVTFKELAEKSGKNTLVEQHPNSNMYFLAFRDTVDIGMATDLFPVSTFAFPSQTFGFNAGVIIPGFTSYGPITKTFNQTYDPIPGAELKKIEFLGGTLRVNLTNNFHHSINLNIKITSLKDKTSNTSLTFNNITLAGYGSSANPSVNLAGYYLDLLDAPSTYNNVKYDVSVTITSSGNSDVSGNVGIQLSINNPTYEQITGKVYYEYTHTNQLYSIDIFESTILADQHLAQPKLTLNFLNSFGVPSTVNFSRFEVENNQGTINTLKNETVRDSTLLIGTPNALNYPKIQKDTSTVLMLDYHNSNIEEMFDIAPRALSFDATFNIGNASDPSHNYFIRNDSRFRLQSEIEIPLLGWVVTNEISDTVTNMDWPDLENDFHIIPESAKVQIKCKFSNELPLNMYIQVYFLDEYGNKVAQLFDGVDTKEFVKSAPIGPNGESSGVTPTISYVDVDNAKYKQISQSQNMKIIYKFSTGGTPKTNVTIISTNYVDVEMSVKASGTIKP